MSGVAGADRVKSRQDFKQFLTSYQQLIAKFPGFISLQPSGSYNSNPDKMDFGDIDLIVHIQSTKDKAAVKKELQAFFHNHPDTVIVPFSSGKHAGKRSYNAGELVSVRYHDDTLGYSAQIDNIVALDQTEASFKQEFLDLPAEKQGLILGLVKIAAIETQPQILFKRLGITARDNLEPNQEYEFNLSSVELQLRLVTYEPGTYKQADRQVLWTSRSFDDLKKLLYQYKLDADFDSLLLQAKQTIKNPRSNARMEGVFSSMITVKSGEVGTAKGAGKEAALAKIQQTFKEHRSLFRSLLEADTARKVVFAFVRFQPPTIGHELLINTVKKTAEQNQCPYVIYVSRKQDHKENPLTVETKIHYLNMMFPGTNFIAAGPTTRTPIEAAVELNQKYTDLILVAGSDRESMFNLLQDYNHKNYEYNSIEFVSAGDRDPDSPGVAGISGTKMREAAVANDFATFQKGLPDSISAEGAQQLMSAVAAGLQKPARAKKGVAEGKVINTYLWHGSRQKIPMLEPRQSVDTGGAAGSNQNAIYATSDPKVAIAMGLTTAGSDTGMFPNDPQMVLFSGKIRKGEYVYLHKLPFNGPDGKPQFVQGGNSREFHSIPGVEGIKPIEIKEIPVNRYLNLIRKATPADLKLSKKYMKKQGVAEGKSVPVSENIENIMNALINKIIVNEAIQNNRK